MSVVHLNCAEFNLTGSLVDRDGVLVKNCIIAIEGEHTCNQGKKYRMPAEFIGTLGDNVNEEIAKGREIGMFSDIETGKPHDKSTNAKFASIVGFVECRPVTESDLPNPDARGMVGKMALFAKAKIFKHLDSVRSGAIKALSPGIDMGRKLIVEVSAVPVASMPGVAFFSYKDVKADRNRAAQLRDKGIECMDTFIESVRSMQGQEMSASIGALQESFAQFIADLAEVFEIPAAEGGIEYSNNPYDPEPIADEIALRSPQRAFHQAKEAGFSNFGAPNPAPQTRVGRKQATISQFSRASQQDSRQSNSNPPALAGTRGVKRIARSQGGSG